MIDLNVNIAELAHRDFVNVRIAYFVGAHGDDAMGLEDFLQVFNDLSAANEPAVMDVRVPVRNFKALKEVANDE